MREWKVSLALSLTLSSLRALKALKAPIALDTAPSFSREVMTLIQKVTRTIKSIAPQELLKYAFGVQKNPSAMTLMPASTVNNSAKAISDHTNQFFTLNSCLSKYSF